jgi:hypothetical protein
MLWQAAGGLTVYKLKALTVNLEKYIRFFIRKKKKRGSSITK